MKSPFQEDIVVDNYYATKHTEESLQAIHAAVRDGIPMVVLSGDEGAGKTMLCHKIDQDTGKDYTSVFFPHTVDSFEDVVRIVAFALNIETEIEGQSKGVEVILSEISASLVQSGKPLLLVIDEAENIYLATLERVRKMLDRFIAEGARFHVLFSGRLGFLENCQQLSMCEFQNTGEIHIQLEPLTLEETREYLLACGEKMGDLDTGAVFKPEVVEDIYKISQGNFRMTNILAEEAARKNGDDTSFMVLLENVKEDIGELSEEKGAAAMVRDYFAQYRSYLPYGGAAVVLIVAAMFYLFSGSREVQVDKQIVQDSPQVATTVETDVVVSTNEQEQPDPSDATNVELKDASTGTEVSMALRENVVPDVAVAKTEGEVTVQQVEEAVSTAPDEELTEVVPEKVVQETPPPVEENITTQEVVVGKIEVQPKTEKKVKVVELYRNDKLKRKPGKLPKTTQETIKSVQEIEKPEPKRNVVEDVIATNAHFTADQLYKKRVMAGSSWYNHKKDDKYTVQLMVLKSKSAEENFKEMLQEDRYRQEAGNFYIFRKLSTSNTLFIFYGEYSSIAKARVAQNSLPPFLQVHKPYALSVKGAMAKVRRQ